MNDTIDRSTAYAVTREYFTEEPKIVAAKVIKITAKQVVISCYGDAKAFNYRTHHQPGEVEFSPEAAVAVYLSKLRIERDNAARDLRTADARIADAERLQKSIGGQS